MTDIPKPPPSLVVKPRELADLAHHAEQNMPAAYQPRLVHLSGEMLEGADMFITSRSVIDLKEPAESRPIGWVSTVSRTGAVNLAPYSYFNIFAVPPHS